MFPVEQPGLSCRRQEKKPSFTGIFRIQGGYPLAELSQCILDSSNGSIINVI